MYVLILKSHLIDIIIIYLCNTNTYYIISYNVIDLSIVDSYLKAD